MKEAGIASLGFKEEVTFELTLGVWLESGLPGVRGGQGRGQEK